MSKAARVEPDHESIAQIGTATRSLEDFETYLRTLRNRPKPLSDSTIDLYLATIRRMLTEELESAFREGLPFDPVGWLENQINPRTPLGTASSLLPAVKHFLGWAHARKILPVENPPRPMPYIGGLPQGTREALDEPDFERFLGLVQESSIPEPSRTILLLLPECGLRIDEVCKLETAHLVARGAGDRKRLGISVLGKGSKVRWVPLSEGAVALLNAYRPELALSVTRAPKAPAGYLFPSTRFASRPTRPVTVRKHLRAARLGWGDEALEAVAPHILRHTFATRLVRRRVPMPIIQRFMGHTNPQTTDRYIQPSTTDYADAIDSLDDEGGS